MFRCKKWDIAFSKSKFLVLLSMLLCNMCLSQFQIAFTLPYTDIDVDTAYAAIISGQYPDLVILDVRTQSEFYDGHLYGAILIPHTELEERIGELTRYVNHEIIVYCRSGARSALACSILDSHNFNKVYNMLGGISAWIAAGYPVTPIVSVSTDEPIYSPGDIMWVNIDLTNQGTAVDVVFVWYLGISGYNHLLPIAETPFSLPGAYDDTFSIPLLIRDWGGAPVVSSFLVALQDPSSGTVVSFNHCVWTYLP